MKKHLKLVFALFIVLSIKACDEENTVGVPSSNSNSTINLDNSDNEEEDNNNNGSNSNWLIPVNQVRDGGPGKDGIPALLNPETRSINQTTYLKDDDLVLAIKIDNEIKVYPHTILDWYEIVNDQIGVDFFAITYCPLTGTGIGWDRKIDGAATTFGVSGLLYNSNLIPYDRRTNSNWSQMRLDCVNGSLIGEKVNTYTLFETTFRTLKSMGINGEVVTTGTGYSRSYGTYPYGDYKTNDDLLYFPVAHEDDRLPKKERIHGIIDGGRTLAVRFEDFSSGVQVYEETLNEKSIIISGSKQNNFIVSFYTTLDDGTKLEFEPVHGSLPVIMSDNEGNRWDIFGYAVSGPRVGSQLQPTRSLMSYWFAWAAFYPLTRLYGHVYEYIE
jgi:hypothetical protein